MFKHELSRVQILGTDSLQTLIDKTRMNNPFNQSIQMEMDDVQHQLDELRKKQAANINLQ